MSPRPGRESHRDGVFAMAAPSGKQGDGGSVLSAPEMSPAPGPYDNRPEPFSPEWLEMWETDPAGLARALTIEERQDPTLNPLHPFATWPAGTEPHYPTSGWWS